MLQSVAEGIVVEEDSAPDADRVLTPEPLAFVSRLHRKFNSTREALLRRRAERQAEFEAGVLRDLLPETEALRSGDWNVAPIPSDLVDRRVRFAGFLDPWWSGHGAGCPQQHQRRTTVPGAWLDGT